MATLTETIERLLQEDLYAVRTKMPLEVKQLLRVVRGYSSPEDTIQHHLSSKQVRSLMLLAYELGKDDGYQEATELLLADDTCQSCGADLLGSLGCSAGCDSAELL